MFSFFVAMKTLYMLRHSLADPKQGGRSDFMRPLSPDGIQIIKNLGNLFHKKQVCFDCILASQAVRAYETALYLAEATNVSNDKIVEDRRLYSADFQAYLNILFEQPDEYSHLAIVGHNPQITALAGYFLKEIDLFLLPGAMVAVKIDTDNWTDLCLAGSELLFRWTPGDK